MQNQKTNPTPNAPAFYLGTTINRGVRGPLSICILIAVAFCGGLQIQVAAAQQNDEPPATSDSTISPAQPNPSAPATRPDDTFIIGADDVLGINVWKEPEISRSIPVRSDGRISLPLIGDVQAAGRTPMQLEGDIAEKLKSYITDPQVTVIVQQINSQKYNILGQVSKPGSYPLTAGT